MWRINDRRDELYMKDDNGGNGEVCDLAYS